MSVAGETPNKAEQLELQSRSMPGQASLPSVAFLSGLLLVLRWREEKRNKGRKTSQPEGWSWAAVWPDATRAQQPLARGMRLFCHGTELSSEGCSEIAGVWLQGREVAAEMLRVLWKCFRRSQPATGQLRQGQSLLKAKREVGFVLLSRSMGNLRVVFSSLETCKRNENPS